MTNSAHNHFGSGKLIISNTPIRRCQVNPLQCISTKRTGFIRKVGQCFMVLIMLDVYESEYTMFGSKDEENN